MAKLTRRSLLPVAVLVASLLADQVGLTRSSAGLVRLTKDDGEYVGVQPALVLAAHVSPNILDNRPLTRIYLFGHAPIDVKDSLVEVAARLGLSASFSISGDATSEVSDSTLWVNAHCVSTFFASQYRRNNSDSPMTDLVFSSGLKLTVLDPPRRVAALLGA